MKEINLPITQTVSLTVDLQQMDMSKAIDEGNGLWRIPLGTLADEGIYSLMETARRNGGKVLYATTSIEQKVEAILLEYFMGPFVRDDERRAIFEREILQSSALSYSSKKELVQKVINESDLLPGSKKNTVQSHLKKIMEWRNAFAHGKLKHNNKVGCCVRYYSGSAKEFYLTDNFWDDVERVFNECDLLLTEAHKQLSRSESAPPAEK